MIDARLVGAFLVVLLVGIVPLVKWLGGMAVASAFEKITGLKVEVSEIRAQREADKDRQDNHGRKLDRAASSAEQAYNKSALAEARVAELTVMSAEIKKDIGKIEGVAEEALTRAVEVQGGLTSLALEHGRLDGRVERAEKDIERNTNQLRELELAPKGHT